MRQKTEQAKKQTRKPSAANPAKANLPARQAAQAIDAGIVSTLSRQLGLSSPAPRTYNQILRGMVRNQ